MASEPRSMSSKHSGDTVEAAVVQRYPLRYVGDSEATWYDAEAVEDLAPSEDLRIGGTCVVEAGTPVEIKAAQVERSNGDRTSRGHWYVKRAAHERLLEAGGAYLLVVYVPTVDHEQRARLVVSADVLDEHLAGRWYEVGGSRSEQCVAQLTWSHLIDPERVDEGR